MSKDLTVLALSLGSIRVTDVDTADPAFLNYIEIKATRDIIIHNCSIINDVNLSKVGNRQRGVLGKGL